MFLLTACDPANQADPDGESADTSAQHSDDDTAPPDGDAPIWDPAAPAVDCAAGADAPLLEAALADAGLTRDDFGIAEQDWADWRTYVDDAFNLSWYADTHHRPEVAVCAGRQLQADLDAAAAAPHPVAALIAAQGAWIDVAFTADPVDPRSLTADDAFAALATATGAATPDLSALDPDLGAALAPVAVALARAVEARAALDASATFANPARLYGGAPDLVLYGSRPVPDIGDPDALEAFTTWYLGEARTRLVEAARVLAFAVEDADLGRFAGGSDTLTWDTPAGVFRVSGAGADVHDDTDVLLHLDLGGDDTWLGTAGATSDDANPVSVLLDLGGDDTYGYVEVADPHDAEGLLPSDDEGRTNVYGYYPSDSDTGRQGSGRYGIGLAWDLGGGADRRTSLRMSQGFGALGVGVLADDGGDDAYASEAASQGAGVWGLGILYDAGGNDVYTSWAFSQGFAYVGSGGLLYDRDGSDLYWADPGRDHGGTTLYYSPQLADGQGNSSFAQGAGFGLRGDSYGVWLSGGLGALRDLAGDDRYVAGVFGQATGYWQGTGILADAAGNDTYDALWYIQGGAAHFALALLLEGTGDDTYNGELVPYNVSLGSGHDLSVGIAVDDAGDDHRRLTTLAAGASNCQGIGVLSDNDGADTWEALSTYGVGLGNHSGECDVSTGRTAYPSIGLFLDSGGDPDTWIWPDPEGRAPADDSSFGIAWNGTDDEHGGAVDGDGATNLQAAP